MDVQEQTKQMRRWLNDYPESKGKLPDDWMTFPNLKKLLNMEKRGRNRMGVRLYLHQKSTKVYRETTRHAWVYQEAKTNKRDKQRKSN